MKPVEILEIEEYYNIELLHIIEDKREESKVMFYKNENTYTLNFKNEVQKLNLKDNNLGNLDGLLKVKNTITDLNLAATRIDNIEILSGFKNLVFLDLSTNNIEDINLIKGLKKLESLYLDNNKISKIPELNLPKLNELWLYSNNIDDISNLKHCLNLQTIDLSNNQIENINVLGGLNRLEIIYLNKNKVFDINVLSIFKSLHALDLSSNAVVDISSLSNFDNIDFLSLKNNQIEDISPLKFIKVIELHIGENKIFDLTPIYLSLKTKKIEFINANDSPQLIYPKEKIVKGGERRIVEWFDTIIVNCNLMIEEVKNSGTKSLDLGMMGLTDLNLIPKLFELVELEELILSNEWAKFNVSTQEWEPQFSDNKFYSNNIVSIPIEITKLKKLKKLIAGGDWKKDNKWNRWRIKDISFLNKLDNIEFVNLSNNQVNTFKITRNLKKIETIHINNNYIRSISISRALNLEYLFLSNNLIKDLNFLKKSKKLKAVDLHSNLITDLYPIKDLINTIGIVDKQWRYDTISISKNDLENPGIEVVQRGKDAVLRRMNSNFRIKTFKNDELKLILVGNSETGKTTLAKYLEKDPKYKEKHSFTLWLDILKIEINNKKINVFDFGGHEYFHDTHHIFFTKNSLYFLIWEELTNSYNQRNLNQIDRNGNTINLQTFDYPMFYWLDSIKHFIKDKSPENFSEEMKKILKGNDSESYYASSLVIKNKVSSNNKLKFLNNESINDKYPFIHDFINIDLHNDKNLISLLDCLNEMIDDLGKLTGGEYPIYYQKIKDNIQEFKSYNGKKFLNFNEFKRLCQAFKRNLTTDEEFIDIAYFLKDIGLILISKDKNTFYLDLNHLSHQIIKIYDGLEKTGGVLNEDEINGKNIDEFENILKLIIDFNMAFTITKKNKKNYVFPLFLPNEPSKIVDLLLKKNLKPYKRIQYKGFIHKGIILHVFSEYSNKIVSEEIDNNTYYWKNGLIVKENDNLVLIKFFVGDDSKDAYIDLYNFDSTEIFIENIKEKIIEINKANNYDVDECVSADGVNFISLKLIHENEENKNEVFLNQDDLKYYRLYDFKKYLKNKNNTMKKVFLSYSRQNLLYKDSLKTHLSVLEKYGLLKAWSCDEIVAGKWNQQIQKELEDADIIIYMVSADFMSSDYIMEEEVKKGITLVENNPEKKIICVLVGVCQWKNWSILEEVYNKSKDADGNFSTKRDLSQFQFLPYHQYKNEKGESIREEIVALEKWGRYPYDVVNEAYNQIVSRVLNEINN